MGWGSANPTTLFSDDLSVLEYIKHISTHHACQNPNPPYQPKRPR